MRGESLGGPGSIPGMECLRPITTLAHLTLPKVQPCLPLGQTASVIRKGAGYSRSSTARKHPDSSGRFGFDSHQARHFRRAAELGLSGKAGNRERLRTPHYRATGGFPTRLLSVSAFFNFRRVAALGYRLISTWPRVRVPPPAAHAGVAQW